MSNEKRVAEPKNSAEAMFWGNAPVARRRPQDPQAETPDAENPESPPLPPLPPLPYEPERRGGGAALIMIGFLAATVGILITATSYRSAVDHGGGTYLVAYGPIAFGVISIVRGLLRLGS